MKRQNVWLVKTPPLSCPKLGTGALIKHTPHPQVLQKWQNHAKSMSAMAYDGSLIAQCPQLNVDIYDTSPGEAGPKNRSWSKLQEHELSTPRLGNLMRFGICMKCNWSHTPGLPMPECWRINTCQPSSKNSPPTCSTQQVVKCFSVRAGSLQNHEHLSDLSAIYIRCWLNIFRPACCDATWQELLGRFQHVFRKMVDQSKVEATKVCRTLDKPFCIYALSIQLVHCLNIFRKGLTGPRGW